MAHQTIVTFQRMGGVQVAIVARGRKKKIVDVESGHRILRGEESIAFSTDEPEPQPKRKSHSTKGPQKTAIERARLALGLSATDARVTECPDGPCVSCGQTGIIYVA